MKKSLEKIKKIYNKTNKTLLFFIIELIFLILIEIFNKFILVRSLNILSLFTKTSLLFSFAWILIILIVLYILNPIIRKIIVIIMNTVLIILSSASFLMYSYFHNIFSFKDMLLAGDGLSFITSIFKFISLKFIIVILIFIILTVVISLIKTSKVYRFKSVNTIIITIIIVLSILCLNYTKKMLSNTSDGWNGNEIVNNNSNYFTNWIEPTRLMKICGSYEYYIRDFYKSFLEKDNLSESKKIVEEYINKNKTKLEKNIVYNGIFKNKNLIFVMMESEDDWMINEKVTPTIYEMMQHGFNFINHYSPGYVTGDTANTEFIANTGQYPSINKLSPNYAYTNNNYSYSIANTFKNIGYSVNSFHRSNSNIYNRGAMHISLGYEKYHSYSDMGISADRLDLDTEIIKNAYSKITYGEKFMSFIITYSPHDPYNYDKIECKENIDTIRKLYPNETNEEILCSYSASRETDNMFKLLIEKLKEDKKLDDTIIVGFSDHRNKDVSPNGEDATLNKTAFFIYDSSMKSNQIETITSSINILPTILNLFGIETEYIYPGYDALNYENGYVIFKDLTYYNGDSIKPLTKDLKEQVDYSSSLLISDYYKNN